MDTFTLEEELDLFVHQQKRLRFQKPIDETTDAEQRKQLTKLQVEERSKDQLLPFVQADLIRLLGVRRDTISQWASGSRHLRPDDYETLLKLLVWWRHGN